MKEGFSEKNGSREVLDTLNKTPYLSTSAGYGEIYTYGIGDPAPMDGALQLSGKPGLWQSLLE